VRRVAAHFRGRVAQWDVVNEPLEDDGGLTPNVFQQAMGEGYIDIAFAEARRADPEAKLFLNEISAERGEKADALVELVTRLKERGVQIDGVGLQNHTTTDDFPTRRDLGRLMDRIARLGLDVEITEMDVEGPDEDGRRDAFEAAAQACARTDRCTGLTVWGVDDQHSWLGAGKRATLFGVDGDAKPAAEALREALRR
jgi:endo-1,4-beta-xylanase